MSLSPDRSPVDQVTPRIALPLIALATACVQSPTPPSTTDAARQREAQDVIEYAVTLEPSLTRPWLRGHEKIVFDAKSVATDALIFTASGLQIANLRIDGKESAATVVGDKLLIRVAPESRSRKESTVTLDFAGAPKRGYDVADGAIVTQYFACDWMVCAQDDFGDKARMSLELILPKKMTTIGPGVLVHADFDASGLFHARWKEDRPYSAYLFAFAAGEFRDASMQTQGVMLRFFGANTTPDELSNLFAPTAAMLAFFRTKAGAPFPQRIFTQLLVTGSAAQEAAAHSIIGRRAIAPIQDDPSEDWVIAHELAHQWWGNAITCRDLSEFWLNEGLTVFMVAAWKEHRWGRAAYVREMELARTRHATAVAAEMDVALTFSGRYPSLSLRRAIQYSKGALFLDALREELGEEVFWRGFANYTRNNMGRTVTSRDFQSAMEDASRRGLSQLFAKWVYGRS